MFTINLKGNNERGSEIALQAFTDSGFTLKEAYKEMREIMKLWNNGSLEEEVKVVEEKTG